LNPRKKLFHVDPLIKGFGLKKVKNVFRMTSLPFVWDKKEIIRENNPNSPYHKIPKGIEKSEKKRFERLLQLRTGIQTAKEKELKHRQDSLNKRPYRGFEKMIKLTMPFMIKQTSAKSGSDFGGKSKGRKMVAEFVKEVPKNKNIAFGRRNQERVKNLMEDKVLDVSIITDAQKNKQKELQLERELRIKDQETKKNVEKNEKLEVISKKQEDNNKTQKEGSDDE
jgi:hypothetical protein